MKILISTLLAIAFLFSCSSSSEDQDPSNNTSTSVDTSAAFETEIETAIETAIETESDSLLTMRQIDSIQKHLKKTGIDKELNSWEKLTEQNGELIRLIPGGGENTVYTIIKDSVYLFTEQRMQEVAPYLITDFKKIKNGFILKILSPTLWPWAIERSESNNILSYKLITVKIIDKEKGFTNWLGMPFDTNSIFVEKKYIKSYKLVEEPNPYE